MIIEFLELGLLIAIILLSISIHKDNVKRREKIVKSLEWRVEQFKLLEDILFNINIEDEEAIDTWLEELVNLESISDAYYILGILSELQLKVNQKIDERWSENE